MKRDSKGLAPPPKNCKCGQPATVVQIEVTHWESGKTRTGAFSEFGEVKGSGKTLTRLLRDGLGFRRWIPQCSECYCGDVNQEEMF